jgi:hypothetical protein
MAQSVAGYGLNCLGSAGIKIFLFVTMSRGYEANPASCQMDTRGSFSKWPEHEADHSAVTSIKIKNVWHYITVHPYAFMAWCCTKHRDKFQFEVILVFLNRNPLFSSCSPSFVDSNYFPHPHDTYQAV